MGVRIRLRRTGGKNDACFRIIVADEKSPRDGRFLENLGWYDPKQTGKNFELKLERLDYWQQRGAALSDTVRSLVKRSKQAAV